jgi:hypothetical protein
MEGVYVAQTFDIYYHYFSEFSGCSGESFAES